MVEPHLVRLEAGQAVGDHLRQHGDDAVGQIDAGGALVGLAVQGRRGRHEMGDVGDVHAQAPMAVVGPFQRNGVVEIAGVDRVDRDHRHPGQVLTAVEVSRASNASACCARFFEDVVGEVLGQAELPHDRTACRHPACRAVRRPR